MRRHHLPGLAAVLALSSSAWAAETVHDRLIGLARDFVYTTARFHPIHATALGIPGHDGELETPTEATRAAEVKRVLKWRGELHRIAPPGGSNLSKVDANDARLLQAQPDRDLHALQVYQGDRKRDLGA